MLHRTLERYESLASCNSRDRADIGSKGKGSEVSRRYRVRYPDARRGRKLASERAEGRIASGSSQEPKRKEDPENDTPVARAASTSAHCATPTLVQLTAAYKFHRQPDPNRPAPCPRRSAITTCPAHHSSPLLSSGYVHTRDRPPATAVSYPALHCMHLLCLNLVAVCVFPGLRHRRRARCCCFPEFPDWLVILLGVT
jgi:hypothetical protein